MRQYADWATFVKLDNATTLDFLTSLGAALADQNQYPDQSLEQLKSSLNSGPAVWSQSGKSIVGALSESQSDILKTLVVRYGISGFALNHMRFTMRHALGDLLNKLAIWEDLSLKKSDLVFNRPFFVKGEAGVDRRELFSQALFAVAQNIHEAIADLRAVLTSLSTMRPSDMLDVSGDLERMEQNIALQIGFAGLDELSSFSRIERKALAKVALVLSELSQSIAGINTHLVSNCVPSDTLVDATALCELLAAEAQRFNGLTLPESQSSMVWEMRRQAICFAIFNMAQIISDLSASVVHAIAPKEMEDPARMLSRDVTRRLASQMFAAGAPIDTAVDAAQKLIAYCLRHEVEPTQVIVAELKKIHPTLTPDTLELLKTLSSKEITATPGGAVSKIRLSEGTKKLRKSLSQLAPFAAPLACIAFLFLASNCGVKTKLKNELPELRPEIPFREQAATPQTELKSPKAIPSTKRSSSPAN